MLKAKIKAETLKEIIDVISPLVDEAKINVEKDKISTRAVDPAHVAMIEFVVNKGAFEEFKADDSEIGLDLDRVKEVLKLAKSGDIIEIVHDEDKNRLVVTVLNIVRNMALVDTAGMSDPKVPNLASSATVVLIAEELRQGIRASESISDHIALNCTADTFEMSSEGDTDSVSLKLPKDLLKKITCKEQVRSLFPLDYFSNMVKAINSSQEVTLLLGNDYPVRIEFDIASGKGKVKYLLAPRIESD